MSQRIIALYNVTRNKVWDRAVKAERLIKKGKFSHPPDAKEYKKN